MSNTDTTSIRFHRPVGAATDVNELEYLSYLHQTGAEIRSDGSIRDEDISTFLKSRYGIEVSMEDVRNTIIKGLGGGNKESDVIDLMELTAILVIPVLVKAAVEIEIRENNNTPEVENGQSGGESVQTGSASTTPTSLPEGIILPPKDLIDYVSKVILHDVTGSSTSKPVTARFLKKMLVMYDEPELAENDELISEMLECCSTVVRSNSSNCKSLIENEIGNSGELPEILFNGRTFARALTYDVLLYDFKNEVAMTISNEDLLPPQVPFSLRKKKKNATSDHLKSHSSNQVHQSNKVRNSGNSKDDNNNDDDGDDDGDDDDTSANWTRIFTAPAIDICADTFRSKFLMVLIWTAAIVSFGAGTYVRNQNSSSNTASNCNYAAFEGWDENGIAMFCQISSSIVTWLIIFLWAGLGGLLYTAIGSIGNTMRCRSWYHPLIGCVPFVLVLPLVNNAALFLKVMNVFIQILAALSITFHVLHTVDMIVPERVKANRPWLRYCLQSGSSKAEQLRKQAIALKLNKLVKNALRLLQFADQNRVHDTYFGHAIDQFAKSSTSEKEQIGGTIWTWKSVWNETLLSEEGISFSVRVIASNIGQSMVCVVIAVISIFSAKTMLEGYDEDTQKTQVYQYTHNLFEKYVDSPIVFNTEEWFSSHVSSFLQHWYDSGRLQLNCSDIAGTIPGIDTLREANDLIALCVHVNNITLGSIDHIRHLNISEASVENITSFARELLNGGSAALVESSFPSEKYMLSIPLFTFVATTILSSVVLALTYLPSATSTVLKMRCGLLPTLHSSKRELYRIAPDTVTLLSGSLFWGCLVSSVLTGALCALVVFFFFWQVTAFLAQRFVAAAIGIATIFIIKRLLMMCFRRRFSTGFYRKRPAAVNFGILALEWANFALTTGIIFVRMILLTLMALFSIGRIYRPFLAPGIGFLGPIELDGYPTIHNRELLAHEAHRHPYIELLGLIYLMKLKYADDFGKSAGSCWRLVFLYALMPWLQKYRIKSADYTNMKLASEGKNNKRSMRLVFKSIRSSSVPTETELMGSDVASNVGACDDFSDHIRNEMNKPDSNFFREMEDSILHTSDLESLQTIEQHIGGLLLALEKAKAAQSETTVSIKVNDELLEI